MFLRDFGITITAAVLISLVEAFTLAPMLSAYFFHRIDPATARARKSGRFFRAFDGLSQGYGRFLAWSLNHRRVVVGGWSRGSCRQCGPRAADAASLSNRPRTRASSP